MMVDINKYTPHRAGTYKEFISSENGCMHIGQNHNLCNIRQFKIDGQVVPSTSKDLRCDFLLLNDDKMTAYYIELKGSDIGHATEQIENSIKMIHGSIKEYDVFRRIVYRTGSHSIQTSKVVQWKAKHIKSVKIASRQLSESI